MPHTRAAVRGDYDGNGFANKISEVNCAGRPVAVLNIPGSLKTVDRIVALQANARTRKKIFMKNRVRQIILRAK
jgi:hypothetical protein